MARFKLNPDPNIDPSQERLRWLQVEKAINDLQRGLDGTPKFGAIAPGGQYLIGQTIVGSNAIGSNVVQQLGFVGIGVGSNFSTANSSTFTDIGSSSFSFTVPNIQGRAIVIIYFVHATCQIVAGSGNCYVLGNIVGFNVTAQIKIGTAQLVPGTIWYFPPGGIKPGTYTAKMQIATDSNTVSAHVDQIFHQIWTMGTVT